MENVRPKIHIIANCTSRKRLPPVIELNSILSDDIKNRAVSWWSTINSVSNNTLNSERLYQEEVKVKAKNLYIGSYWSRIRSLPDIANVAGFEVDLWVISAGYGLISSSDEIYSYSATFTPGDKNSIINSGIDSNERNGILRKWWEIISNFSISEKSSPRKLSQLLKNNNKDYFLVIASSDYLSAIEKDLLEGIDSLFSRKNILIITSKSFHGKALQDYIIPSDARLQCNGRCARKCEKHLIPRGVRGTISAFLASKILEKLKDVEFDNQKLKRFIEKKLEESPSLINFNRTRLSDKEVCNFIENELKENFSVSCAYLLRKLRNQNLACEQKRFKDLYWEMREACYEKKT